MHATISNAKIKCNNVKCPMHAISNAKTKCQMHATISNAKNKMPTMSNVKCKNKMQQFQMHAAIPNAKTTCQMHATISNAKIKCQMQQCQMSNAKQSATMSMSNACSNCKCKNKMSNACNNFKCKSKVPTMSNVKCQMQKQNATMSNAN